MFNCRHDWKVLSDVILESGFEQMQKTQNPARPFKVRTTHENIFIKTHHLVVCCGTCGKIRGFCERNFIGGH